MFTFFDIEREKEERKWEDQKAEKTESIQLKKS